MLSKPIMTNLQLLIDHGLWRAGAVGCLDQTVLDTPESAFNATDREH